MTNKSDFLLQIPWHYFYIILLDPVQKKKYSVLRVNLKLLFQ